MYQRRQQHSHPMTRCIVCPFPLPLPLFPLPRQLQHVTCSSRHSPLLRQQQRERFSSNPQQEGGGGRVAVGRDERRMGEGVVCYALCQLHLYNNGGGHVTQAGHSLYKLQQHSVLW